ncbi:MAG: arginine--tRNA ligase [Coprococcus sp.]
MIDVQEETDTKEIPPCMIQKSDGASLYGTTDLATLVQRVQDYHPDKVAYVVDKRQELHFTQVFRAAKKTGIVPAETELKFLGFRYHEWKRWQAVQDKRRRGNASGDTDLRDYREDV